jgi:DNA-binding transcriptional LysR family regulator
MLVMPELRLLRTFAVVAQEGSLSRAAARLQLAQQSVSQ